MSALFTGESKTKCGTEQTEVWNQDPDTLMSNELVWFTDGSRMPEGSRALGSRLKCLQPWPVYQKISNEDILIEHIQICTDSQATLHALKYPRITSRVVLECTNSLAALGQRNRVILVWVLGHSGVAGNEKADALTRTGSSDPFTGPEPPIGLPYICSYPQGSIDD
ncbi:hypothetical protein NQ315_002962 [Exocentrus adspersus]|uniref:RNase H type-1 domain-containing protein n=1 Tax=Exocentrus adspersus TaxID=1586481 RepID=A0AAV8W429_9CUCU|nr:hypothetical protein NQ315_002962 [Exocentrus adspersus]